MIVLNDHMKLRSQARCVINYKCLSVIKRARAAYDGSRISLNIEEINTYSIKYIAPSLVIACSQPFGRSKT